MMYLFSYHIVTPFVPEFLLPLIIAAVIACIVFNVTLYIKVSRHITLVKTNLNLTEPQVRGTFLIGMLGL